MDRFSKNWYLERKEERKKERKRKKKEERFRLEGRQVGPENWYKSPGYGSGHGVQYYCFLV